MLKLEHTEVVGWEAAIRGMRNPLESWERSDSFWNYHPCEECNGNASCIDDFHIGENDHDLMTRLRDAGTDHRKFMRFLDVYVDITAPLYWWKEFKTYRVGRAFGDDEPDILPIPEDYLEFDIEMNSCSTMHKIHSKEFTLEDFSHEHLMNFDNSNYWEEDDDNSCFIDKKEVIVPMALLGDYIIPMLNVARQKYVEVSAEINKCHFNELEKKARLVALQKQYWWQMIQLLPSSYNQKRTLKLTYEVLANMYKSRRNHKLDEWHTFCDWIESLPYSELITGSECKKSSRDGKRLQRAVEQMRDATHPDISGLRVGVIGASLGALNATKNPMPDMLEQKGYTRTIEDGKIKYEKREETPDNETDH